MNHLPISSQTRQHGPAAGAGAGTTAAIASLFAGDATATPFNDQLAQFDPLLRAGAADTPLAEAKKAKAGAGRAAAAESPLQADATNQPADDVMADWIRKWLPANGTANPRAPGLVGAIQAGERGARLDAGGRRQASAGTQAIAAPADPASLSIATASQQTAIAIEAPPSPAGGRQQPPAVKTSDNTDPSARTPLIVDKRGDRSPVAGPTPAAIAAAAEPADRSGHAVAGDVAAGVAGSRVLPLPDARQPQREQTDSPAVDARAAGQATDPAAAGNARRAGEQAGEATPLEEREMQTSPSDPAAQTGLPMAMQMPAPMPVQLPIAGPAAIAMAAAQAPDLARQPAASPVGQSATSEAAAETDRAAAGRGKPMVAAGETAGAMPQHADSTPAQPAQLDRAQPGRPAAREPSPSMPDHPNAYAAEPVGQEDRRAAGPADGSVADPVAMSAAATTALPLPPALAEETRPRTQGHPASAGDRMPTAAPTTEAHAAIAAPVVAAPGAPAADTPRRAAAAATAGSVLSARASESANPVHGEQARVSAEARRSGDFAHALEQASLPQAVASQAPTTAHSTSQATPLQLRLDTPLTAPEFRDALGVQVSVLARDGVQFAELSLNPAEMGPISIRIEIDGQHAHVEFGADSAATRAVIESGLPELASALRDAGLTLTGGGVSEQQPRSQAETSSQRQSGDPQSQQGRNGQPRADGTRPGADGEASRELLQPRRAQLRGGVDLYA